MEIGGKAMATEKNKGAKWDGKSRVSNDLYRKRHEEIFGKKEQDQLTESYKQSLKNKKEREEELKEIEDRNGF